MPAESEPEEPAQEDAVATLAAMLQADFYLFAGPIDYANAFTLIRCVEGNKKEKDVALVLSTFGGDPHAAYRIIKCLKTHYETVTLFIFGFCKSAGTLIALGADKIIMSNWGELGPLDVQVAKPDELTERSSGLDLTMALQELKEQAFTNFETHFVTIKRQSRGAITTKTAADIATHLAVGLLAPISGQIDPIRLGETQRSMKIASHYGEMLGANPDALDRLTNFYPSHSFVIDCDEAKLLFGNVEKANGVELAFEDALRKNLRHIADGKDPVRLPPDEGGFIGVISTTASNTQPNASQDENPPSEPQKLVHVDDRPGAGSQGHAVAKGRSSKKSAKATSNGHR